MESRPVIGVDVGGTKVSAGIVYNNKVEHILTEKISADMPESYIIDEIAGIIEKLNCAEVKAIGIGVPSLVDVEKGIVYDVQNIPSWQEVHLKEILGKRFFKNILVNNDANCFAMGERYFGKGKSFNNMVGITLGTGIGAGVIINGRLYSGFNCGSGEFGSIPYRSSIYEHYCSGQFFKNEYGIDGVELFHKANAGDRRALDIYDEFGYHLGNAVKTILFSVDPEAILLGGSVSKAYDFFKFEMRKTISSFPYKRSIDNLVIEKSSIASVAILGAAALCYEAEDVNLFDLQVPTMLTNK